MRHLKNFLVLIFLWAIVLFVGSPVSAQTNSLPTISSLEATNYINQDVMVTDKVAQVVFRTTVVLMNLNKKYPECPLTCVIRNQDTNKFSDLEEFAGKRVVVTGRIVNYQGRPEFVLTSPRQIKIVEETPAETKAAPPAAPAPPRAETTPRVQATNIVAAAAPSLPGTEHKTDLTGWWIAGALTVIIALLVMLVLLFWRGSKPKLPEPDTSLALANLPAEPPKGMSAEEWKRRALVAEAMAGKEAQLVREKIIPELTEFAKQSLVQGLFAQRKALIDAHQEAQRALAELEGRLASLHLPLQERIQAYEARVAELEKEVATQGEGVRELTRATLTLVRRKLEEERQLQRTRQPFN